MAGPLAGVVPGHGRDHKTAHVGTSDDGLGCCSDLFPPRPRVLTRHVCGEAGGQVTWFSGIAALVRCRKSDSGSSVKILIQTISLPMPERCASTRTIRELRRQATFHPPRLRAAGRSPAYRHCYDTRSWPIPATENQATSMSRDCFVTRDQRGSRRWCELAGLY
jgi:hypothetical protein